MTADIENITIFVVNAFLSYTAIALNSITIYAMRKTSSLPKPLRTLLLSLAVSDLGVGLIVQPLFIVYRSRVMKLAPNFGNNSTDQTILTAYLIPMYLFSFASFFGVTAVTMDRFLAIHLHLRYQELVTHKRVVAVVITIWMLSAILPLIRQFVPTEKESTFIIFATIQVVCLTTAAALYYKIYLAVRHHTNQLHALHVQQQALNGEQMADVARLRIRKSAIGTFYVYLVFLACYLPRMCIFVSTRFFGFMTTAMMGWYPYTSTLVFLNSSLNPLIYCWKMRHIRHAIMDTLRKILPTQN